MFENDKGKLYLTNMLNKKKKKKFILYYIRFLGSIIKFLWIKSFVDDWKDRSNYK
jgi:hypothetical protein